MSDINLSELTVIELRKVAKEMKVPLQAGISKQGIIDKLSAAMAEQSPAPVEDVAAPAEEPAAAESAVEDDDDSDAAEAPQPQFKPAYQAPQRFNNRPAYQAPAYNRAPAARTPAPMESQRPQNTRPVGFQSRFGPAAAQPPRDSFQEDERPRQEQPRPSFGPARTNYGEPTRFNQPAYEQRPTYEQRPSYEPAAEPARQSNTDAAPFTVNPTVEELVQAVDTPDVTGVLELLPEGFGFLRSQNMLAGNKDVYVSPRRSAALAYAPAIWWLAASVPSGRATSTPHCWTLPRSTVQNPARPSPAPALMRSRPSIPPAASSWNARKRPSSATCG